MKSVSYSLAYKSHGTIYQDLYFYNVYVGSVMTHCNESQMHDPPIWSPSSMMADCLTIPDGVPRDDASRLISAYARALSRFVWGDGKGPKIGTMHKRPLVWSLDLWRSSFQTIYKGRMMDLITFQESGLSPIEGQTAVRVYRYPHESGLVVGREVMHHLCGTWTPIQFDRKLIGHPFHRTMCQLYNQHTDAETGRFYAMENAFRQLASPRLDL